MKEEIIQLLTERVALINYQTTAGDFCGGVESYSVAYFAGTAREEETSDRNDYDADVESVLADFDFEPEEKTDFDVFMTVRYYWRDWNALYTEIF